MSFTAIETNYIQYTVSLYVSAQPNIFVSLLSILRLRQPRLIEHSLFQLLMQGFILTTLPSVLITRVKRYVDL